MDNDAAKEQWIDRVMAGTNGITKAEPQPGLTERISRRLAAQPTREATGLPVMRWVAAAAIVLSLNICSAIYSNRQETDKTQNTADPFTAIMQSATTYNY